MILNATGESIGTINSLFGGSYARSTSTDLVIGRSIGANRRGFGEWNIASKRRKIRRLIIRFRLLAKAGLAEANDQFQVVWPPTDLPGTSVLTASDESIWNEVQGAEHVLGYLPMAAAIGIHELPLSNFANEAFEEMLAAGQPFNVGLRFKDNAPGVNWTLARADGIALLVRFRAQGSRRALMGCGR